MWECAPMRSILRHGGGDEGVGLRVGGGGDAPSWHVGTTPSLAE